MSFAAIFYLFLGLILFVGIRTGLYKLFEKAGHAGWQAFIPVYSDFIWLKIIGRPLWWLALTLVPVVRTLVKVSMNIDLARAFGKHKFWEQFKAVVIPFIYYPQIGFDAQTQYLGPAINFDRAIKQYETEQGKALSLSKKKKGEKKKNRRKQQAALYKQHHKELGKHFKNIVPPKSGGREWADAFLYAGVAALIIRTFFLEAFMIPTSSMERTLMAGDFLFVSKFHYGVRMPMMPLSVPFVHNKVKVGNFATRSYLDWIQLPYYRLPGLRKVQRNDIVVFNYPAHDYEAIRGDVISTVKPISMKENYIKRCVGIPGDQLELRQGELYINGKPAAPIPGKQDEYEVTTKGGLGFSCKKMKEMGFRTMPCGQTSQTQPVSRASNKNWGSKDYKYFLPSRADVINPSQSNFTFHMTESLRQKVEQHPAVQSLKMNAMPKGETNPQIYPLRFGTLCPRSCKTIWAHNEDNFNLITIPQKGWKVDISIPRNFYLYRRVIQAYEGKTVAIKQEMPVIDGKQTKMYTFEKDYYFMMGDNRHNSDDSRFWGFVPEDHIVGRPLFVFMSYEKSFGFRLGRIGTKHTH